jgi:hypothetical protein
MYVRVQEGFKFRDGHFVARTAEGCVVYVRVQEGFKFRLSEPCVELLNIRLKGSRASPGTACIHISTLEILDK